MKGKGKEFGIEKGASHYDRLKGLVGNLQQRKQRGENLDKVLEEIAPESVAQNALRSLTDQGVESMDRWRGLVDKTPRDSIQQFIDSRRLTEEGRQQAVDAAQGAAHARMGARNDTLARRRQIADVEATEGGLKENVGWGERAAVAGLQQVGLGDDLETQQVNRQMIRRRGPSWVSR